MKKKCPCKYRGASHTILSYHWSTFDGERRNTLGPGERATILELPWENQAGRVTAELTALAGARVVGEHRHPALTERFTPLEGDRLSNPKCEPRRNSQWIQKAKGAHVNAIPCKAHAGRGGTGHRSSAQLGC